MPMGHGSSKKRFHMIFLEVEVRNQIEEFFFKHIRESKIVNIKENSDLQIVETALSSKKTW